MTKRNRCLCLFLTMAVCLTIFNIGTVFADGTTDLTGTGTSTDPYLIGTLDELKAFRDLVNNGTACDAHVKLTADIDLNGENWTPIADGGHWDWPNVKKYYTGTFDGDGHCVKNILTRGADFQGFFGATNGATIKNFGIESGTIKTNNGGAAIVAAAYTTLIEKCYNKADVEAAGVRAGGLAGYLRTGASGFPGAPTIKNCYNLGDVSGTGDELAGISLDATIENCYFAGTIITTAANKWEIGNGTVSNSYALNKTAHCGRGTKATADQFASGEIAYNLGPEFGQKIGTDPYPVFRMSDNKVYLVQGVYTNDPNGTTPTPDPTPDPDPTPSEEGSEDNPILIGTEDEFTAFAARVNGGESSLCAKLTADIELSTAYTASVLSSYTGVLDGDGHSISNLSITSTSGVGFIRTMSGGEIKNLGLENVNIKGGAQSGAFIANSGNDVKITRCWVEGTVEGGAYTGGFTGRGGVVIESSYFVGTVTGTGEIAGLAADGTVRNSFVKGLIRSTTLHVLKLTNASAAKCVNSYYENAEAKGSVIGYGSQKGADSFESGELACLLNEGIGDEVFGQMVGRDTHPVMYNETNKVVKTDLGYSNPNAVPAVSKVEFIRQDGAVCDDPSAVSKYTSSIVLTFNGVIKESTVDGKISISGVSTSGTLSGDKKSYTLTLDDALAWGNYTLTVKAGIENTADNILASDWVLNLTCKDDDTVILSAPTVKCGEEDATLSDFVNKRDVSIALNGFNPHKKAQSFTLAVAGYTKDADGYLTLKAFDYKPFSITADGDEALEFSYNVDTTDFEGVTDVKIFVWEFPIQNRLTETVDINN